MFEKQKKLYPIKSLKMIRIDGPWCDVLPMHVRHLTHTRFHHQFLLVKKVQ